MVFMTVTEILKLADELVFASQGKHLDDLQEEIIQGVYEGKTYREIAEESQWSESRVRNIASELWKLLSKELGENIEKANFRSTFNRLNISLSPSSQNICVNFGSQILYNSKQDNQRNQINHKSKIIYEDLTLAPQIIKFYNRETELETLQNWILNQNIRLISVLGLSGIGKTVLVKRFVDLNLEQFEVIIWRSLKYPKSLDLLINDLLNVCHVEIFHTTSLPKYLDDKFKKIFDLFTNKKCLIILDDVQNIFITGQIAGQYQPEYQDYQNFFTMISETQHQSNIILISREQCAEMESLHQALYPIKCLELSGLDDINILNDTGLKNENSYLQLIKFYEGNLMYLKTIATLIKKNYDGQVSEFLAENTLHITSKMQFYFREVFNHLSPIEQNIVLQLIQLKIPIFREDLRQSLNLSSVEFNNYLQSLQQRYLVTKIKSDKILFDLSPVFREYVKIFETN